MTVFIRFALVYVVAGCMSAASTPEVTYRASDGHPLWVSERQAFDDSGELREDLFSTYSRERFARIRAKNQEECVVFTGTGPLEIFEPMDSLQALVAHSKAIVTGEIVSAEQGFYAENAGTLFTIALSEPLLPATSRLGATAQLFVGSAKIRTPKGLICAMVPPPTPVLAVGDRVLFFAYLTPLSADHPVFQVDLRKQIVIQSKAAFHTPRSLATGATDTDLDILVERVKDALKQKESSAGVKR